MSSTVTIRSTSGHQITIHKPNNDPPREVEPMERMYLLHSIVSYRKKASSYRQVSLYNKSLGTIFGLTELDTFGNLDTTGRWGTLIVDEVTVSKFKDLPSTDLIPAFIVGSYITKKYTLSRICEALHADPNQQLEYAAYMYQTNLKYTTRLENLEDKVYYYLLNPKYNMSCALRGIDIDNFPMRFLDILENEVKPSTEVQFITIDPKLLPLLDQSDEKIKKLVKKYTRYISMKTCKENESIIAEIVQKINETAENCPICYVSMTDADLVKAKCCNVKICRTCWPSIVGTCPYCRNSDFRPEL